MTSYTIEKARKLPGSTVIAYNVTVNGSPFGVVTQYGRGSVWLCKPLVGETTSHATLDAAKVAMMDLILKG